MSNWVQVVTSPTADTPGACLLLHFDHRRYVFGNLSEGLQRALTQRKVGMAKIEQMFVTGAVNWHSIGGMVGMILTVADTLDGSRREMEAQNEARRLKGKAEVRTKAAERLEIHGGPNLAYTLATCRFFVFRKQIPIKPCEFTTDPRLGNPYATEPDWEDDSIRVWTVPIYQEKRPASRKRSHDRISVSDEESEVSLNPTRRKEDGQKDDQNAIATVVESMFNSGWSIDALVPTTLHKVKLPATIFVRDEQGQISKYAGRLPDKHPDVPDMKVWVREPWPGALIASIPKTSPSAQSMCYIVKNKGRRGKFNPKVAKELGVAMTDFKLLTNGQNAPGKDGKIVTPDMVLDARIPGNGFAVVDIQDMSYLDNFFTRPEWSNQELLSNVAVFYWILARGIVDDSRLQKFMNDRPAIKHVVLSPDTSPNMLALESHAGLVTKLHRIDPERFPLLQYDNSFRDLGSSISSFEAGRVGRKVHILPQLKFMDDEMVPFPNVAHEASTMDEQSLILALRAKEQIKQPEFLAKIEEAEQDIPNRDAEVIPLGTGSALPSKYRNVSATLIRVPGYGSYLLDSGENTVGQLRRMVGEEETTRIMSELRCLFISHPHADHHLGTASVLKAWHLATKESKPDAVLSVSCPDVFQKWVEEYAQVEDLGINRIRFIGMKGNVQPNDPSGLSDIQRVAVSHCFQAHAGVLTWPSGLKVAYSGDCRPSDDFVRVGQGATLLIHESTFDDDKASDARAKKHSTMSEALDVARRMGARRVLLTHFSQRYAKMPTFADKTTSGPDAVKDQVVLMAFDQMRVKLGEFRKAEAFLPALRRFLELEEDK
jgi:ribonuclease Z